MLEKLSELGIADDTLVVVFSDHGEEFLEHGGHFHEENVYGNCVNVPSGDELAFGTTSGWWPRISLLNLAPTVDLAADPTPCDRA